MLRPLLLVAALAWCSIASALVRERCAWIGSTAAPSLDDVLSTPAVIDLDGDGIADVAFLAFDWSGGSMARLVAISGADCRVLFDVGAPGCRACAGDTTCRVLDRDGDGTVLQVYGLAAGDIDGDRRPELVAFLEGDEQGWLPQRLIAFEHDGAFKWCSEAIPLAPGPWSPFAFGLPALADLDGDGRPEIVAGARVFDGDGRLLAATAVFDQLQTTSFAVDVDADGESEIVLGAALLDRSAALRWHRDDIMPLSPGSGRVVAGSAAVDLDGDGLAEIVLGDASSRQVLVLDGTTGVTRAAGPFPSPVTLCAPFLGMPAIGDVDGDGLAEIALASAEALCVSSWLPGPPEQVVPRWCHPIDDCSSGLLAPSLADVDGDGLPEILLRDELAFWILDGDGTVLANIPNSSVTAFESVVAADVDGDCEGELILTADDALTSTSRGLRILEGSPAPLPPYRPAWNQGAYHLDNVRDDGSVPPAARAGSTFRQQAAPLPEVVADRASLWPPNHRMVRVSFEAGGAQVRVARVFQDEPLDGRGDGAFEPDAILDGDGVLLRAERSGRGDGRVYHVEVVAGTGTCAAASIVTVCVPHDQRRGRRAMHPCVDQGPLFDSTAP